MNPDYYDKKIYIPCVDEKDNYLGPIERWEAHEKGILHRAFTIALFYKDAVICQHRKHPVFGGYFDLTASSHPQVVEEKVQSNEDAVLKTLDREWSIDPKSVNNLRSLGFITYKTKDPNSEYVEHECCYFYSANVNSLPQANYNVSYGFTLQSIELLRSKENPFYASLAPWVITALKKNLL